MHLIRVLAEMQMGKEASYLRSLAHGLEKARHTQQQAGSRQGMEAEEQQALLKHLWHDVQAPRTHSLGTASKSCKAKGGGWGGLCLTS